MLTIHRNPCHQLSLAPITTKRSHLPLLLLSKWLEGRTSCNSIGGASCCRPTGSVALGAARASTLALSTWASSTAATTLTGCFSSARNFLGCVGRLASLEVCKTTCLCMNVHDLLVGIGIEFV